MPAFTPPTTASLEPVAGSVRAALPAALRLGYSWPVPSTVVITAHGDIDASNAGDLIVFVHAKSSYRGLVLDMSGVTFFGTDGLSALNTIEQMRPALSSAVLIPSSAVVRLLSLCSSAPAMQIVENLDAALAAVHGERTVLQLVTQLA